MNLCIDIGNTLTKAALFENDQMVELFHYEKLQVNETKELLNRYAVDKCIVSSVAEENKQVFELLTQHLSVFINLTSQTKLPVENLYRTKDTLGKDRIAAIVGANYLYPQRNILVIDAGSAITFDIINENGQFLGGNISPGLKMRFRALHEFTQRLPLLEADKTVPLLGKETREAIIAGVQNSVWFETDAYIAEFKSIYQNLTVLVTGGDANFFDNKLKNSIFVVSNLVLVGLNRILNFNA